MRDSGVMYEIHLIQNFAPSNLNRDDTNQPKSAHFGGVRRARISSQCIKRAVREWWRANNQVTLGDRTKRLQQLIMERLQKEVQYDETELREAVREFTKQYYSGVADGANEITKVLLFVSPDEVETCANAIKELWPNIEKKENIEKQIKKSQSSADIALFGRMLAEHPELNTDGACQVAHLISTHKVDMEMDFFTAVDDLNPAEETGAGMMGIVGFNSACFYRYALLDCDQLARNLSGKTERENSAWVEELTEDDYVEADKVIRSFLEAMVFAIPTGKQRSFAAQNLPSFGLFIRRKGGVPVSLANAFATPVRSTRNDEDIIGLSVHALSSYWSDLRRVYGNQGIQAISCFHVGQESRLGELREADKGSVEAAIEAVMRWVD